MGIRPVAAGARTWLSRFYTDLLEIGARAVRFHQILNEELGCASYLLADGGEAIVVDPRWDVDVYLELAAAAGARIVHVVETHDHADHVSGRGRLTRRTGAQAHRPHRECDALPGLRPGDELRAGRIRMHAIATPGHRPEHVSLLVSDGERDVDGWCLLAGDSLLVGDVARPDLAVAPDEGARDLHASVQRILALGDHVELWPAHVGGSLCGGGRLSAKTSSTIGFERRAQPSMQLAADDFVSALAGRTPPRPPNIARIVALNQGPLDAEPAPPAQLDAAGLRRAVEGGATVIDVRPAADFGALHLRGALALGTGANRATRVGWTVQPEEPLVVVGRDVAGARRFAASLHAVGLWAVAGVTAADPAAWRAAGCPLAEATRWSVDDLAEAVRAGVVTLLDVRRTEEYDAGHVAGSLNVPLDVLADGRGFVAPRSGPIAVACATGPRAALAASLLRRAGHREVVSVDGGGVPDLVGRGVALRSVGVSIGIAA
jgi:hydroxyacylglutathione hydrolase